MPEVSRFLGIVIAIYYNDHAPPHFHAKYGRDRAGISIRELAVIEGGLPPRIVALVLEWAFMHREELLANWDRARREEELLPIEPLV